MSEKITLELLRKVVADLQRNKQRPGNRPALTPRQLDVFVFLMEYRKAKGMPPTRREIADEFGFKSPNTAQGHLEALERKGYITLGSGRSRDIRVHP